MDKLREHGKAVRQYLKAAQALKSLGLIDDIGNQSFAAVQADLIARSTPGVSFKQQYPRHGMRWEEDEKQQLIAQAEAGMLDVDAFAREYQRRPESVIIFLKRLFLACYL